MIQWVCASLHLHCGIIEICGMSFASVVFPRILSYRTLLTRTATFSYIGWRKCIAPTIPCAGCFLLHSSFFPKSITFIQYVPIFGTIIETLYYYEKIRRYILWYRLIMETIKCFWYQERVTIERITRQKSLD